MTSHLRAIPVKSRHRHGMRLIVNSSWESLKISTKAEKNISRTARKFAVDRKKVHLWVQKEEKITKQKSRSKADGWGCKARCPFMEDKLYKEFLDLRKEGQKVKRWWFDTRAKQLMNELYPDVKHFKYSDKWIRRFCKRKNRGLRKTTHAAQHAPVNLSATISKFHAKLLRVQRRNFQLGDIANMDQTPLPDDGKTYDNAGSKEAWSASAASGLDKHQCAV